jgi:hypothetical protein
MSTEYCVYNETRDHLLAPRVAALDTRTDPLRAVKVLIEGLAPNAATGLWLNPLKSIPAVPRLSAYDLVYLDRDGHVVHGVELVPDDEAPRIQGSAVSALLLPIHSFAASRAVPGDRFILRRADEMPAVAPAVAAPSHVARPTPAPEPTSKALVPMSVNAPVEKAGPQALPPLSWQPAPAPFESFVPSTALEPVPVRQPLVEIEAPAPRKSPRFTFLRSLGNLHIHIHISIATTSPGAAIVPQRKPQPRVLRSGRSLTDQLTRLPANALAVLRPRAAQGASFLRRQWDQSKTAYVRWADSFIFRPAAKSATRLSTIPDTRLLPPPIGSVRKPRFLR